MMTIRSNILPLVAVAAFLVNGATAADWSQYRGPDHNGSSSEIISTQWPAGGLHPVWTVPLTDGFSTFTVGGGKAFTLVTRDVEGAGQEVCLALDAETGHELWSAPLGIASYDNGGNKGTEDNDGGDGPRSTPAYDNGKIYTYSSRMVLKCMDANTGKLIWASNLIRDHAGRNIHWESAASPLIDGNLVFVAAGGPGQALLAFDKRDGHVVWKGQSDLMTQSSPIAATILGQRQIIFYTQSGLVSVAPTTGAVLWRFPFRYATSAAMSPVVWQDMVYVSAGYGVGTAVCKVRRSGAGFAASELWYKPGKTLVNHWSTPVCDNGYLYGIYGQAQFGRAPLQCVEMATGDVKWSHPGFGPGGCTLVNGNVLVLSDAGDLVLVKAAPAAYTEVARSHVLAGKCWNSPSISNGRIYARSTQQGVSLDVSEKQ